jgi:hypothetical protein
LYLYLLASSARFNPQAPLWLDERYLSVMADYGMMPRPNYMTVRPARAAPEKDLAV